MKIRKSKYHQKSVKVVHCGALIWRKFSTNCDAHLAESLFQTCARIAEFRQREDLPEVYLAVSQHPLYQ